MALAPLVRGRRRRARFAPARGGLPENRPAASRSATWRPSRSSRPGSSTVLLLGPAASRYFGGRLSLDPPGPAPLRRLRARLRLSSC
ncbi:MAG: hypothetical protein MZV64_64240 [Ignavibacteriales bacterium]|nr:hypothetical protein [Ignavibacteriales bacterium]